MNTHWNIKQLTEEEQAAAERLSAELDISPVAGRILAGRGLRTAAQARSYIRPSLDSLHDPFLMQCRTWEPPWTGYAALSTPMNGS